MKTSQFDTSWYVEQEAKIQAAARPKVGEYASPPAATGRHGHIYVIEFSTGVVKVGKTISPQGRLATHSRAARIHGVDILRSWVSVRHPGCGATERQLIWLCRRRGASIEAEYFQGIPFEDVRAVAQLLVEDAVQDQTASVRLAADAVRRAYLDKLIEAADYDLSMTWRDAHDRLDAGEIDGLDGEAVAA